MNTITTTEYEMGVCHDCTLPSFRPRAGLHT